MKRLAIAKRKGGQGRVGKGGLNGKEKDFAWGEGCMMWCADGILLSCTLET